MDLSRLRLKHGLFTKWFTCLGIGGQCGEKKSSESQFNGRIEGRDCEMDKFGPFLAGQWPFICGKLISVVTLKGPFFGNSNVLGLIGCT